MSSVADVFNRPGVKAFGKAIRTRLRPTRKIGDRWVPEKDLDYATLAELENAQTPEQLAEVLKSFLRRFRAYANKARSEHREYTPQPPTEPELLDLISIPYEFDNPDRGTAVVRAALIAHALVRTEWTPDDEEDIDDE